MTTAIQPHPAHRIYSKPDCDNCEKSKKLLDALGVTYEEIDLSTNPAALAMIKQAGFRAAPVLVPADATEGWSGYKEEAIRALAA